MNHFLSMKGERKKEREGKGGACSWAASLKIRATIASGGRPAADYSAVLQEKEGGKRVVGPESLTPINGEHLLWQCPSARIAGRRRERKRRGA